MYIPNPHPRLLEPSLNGQPKLDYLAWFNDGTVITDAHYLANPNKPNFITVKPLPEAQTQVIIKPRMAILHTQASGGKVSNQSAWAYSNRADIKLEPHIFGPEFGTGFMLQAMPFNKRADVSAAANGFYWNNEYVGAVSAETQDNGGKTVDVTPWDFAQVGALVQWLTAVCFVYRIRCTDTAHDKDSGISPHNRWPSWSSAAHSCPGAARTRQVDAIRAEVASRLAHIMEFTGDVCP